MKKWILILIPLTLFSLTACANRTHETKENVQQETNRQQGSLYQDGNQKGQMSYSQRAPDIEPNDRMRNSGQNKLGYFHVDRVNNQLPDVYIDRSILAKHIAQLVASLPQAHQPTTLVTDDHVFIGLHYKSTSKGQKPMSKEQVKKEVRKIAESVTPRYYKIHVTDRSQLETKMKNIGLKMHSNGDVEGIHGDLHQLLKEMGDETPPG